MVAVSEPEQVSLKGWHINKDLKKVRGKGMWIFGKSIPDKGMPNAKVLSCLGELECTD